MEKANEKGFRQKAKKKKKCINRMKMCFHSYTHTMDGYALQCSALNQIQPNIVVSTSIQHWHSIHFMLAFSYCFELLFAFFHNSNICVFYVMQYIHIMACFTTKIIPYIIDI